MKYNTMRSFAFTAASALALLRLGCADDFYTAKRSGMTEQYFVQIEERTRLDEKNRAVSLTRVNYQLLPRDNAAQFTSISGEDYGADGFKDEEYSNGFVVSRKDNSTCGWGHIATMEVKPRCDDVTIAEVKSELEKADLVARVRN